MIENLIKEHIVKLSTFDVVRFAKENNIFCGLRQTNGFFCV